MIFQTAGKLTTLRRLFRLSSNPSPLSPAEMALFDAFHALSLRQRRSLRNSLLNSPFVKVNKWIYWSTQITKKDINQLHNSRTGFWGKMHPECKCPHWYPATQKASGHEEQDSTNAYIPHWAVVHSTVWLVLKRWNSVYAHGFWKISRNNRKYRQTTVKQKVI